MKLLAYVSDISEQAKTNPQLLQEIYEISKKNNPGYGIDGVLFFTGTQFIQVIEGPEASIEHLMQKVYRDSRHQNVKVILEAEIDGKSLQEWNMQPLDLSNHEYFTREQLAEVMALMTSSVEMNGDSFVFTILEMLKEPEFIEALSAAA